MKQEIAPKDSPRGQAFELWKTAGMPKVTIFKTLNVGRLVVASRRNDMKFNMLMCWCIGRAALNIREFYTLPAGGRLWQYDRLAVKVVVKTSGGVRLCDIPFADNLRQFNADYLRLTRLVQDTDKDHLLGDEYMTIDTSALTECEIDGVVSVYSELFTNPFVAWGRYRRKLFKTMLPVSFQFHHAQMDGFEAARYLNALQETIDTLKV